MKRQTAIAALVLAFISPPASAETITGRASVIDGDTIEIHGERIRVLDIDAPESRQTCISPQAYRFEWRCGSEAANKLANLVGARTVTCEMTRKDQYERWLARCSVAGNDLALWLVTNGWAVPYRDCKCEVIRDAANRAKAQQLGIWSGTFVMSWEWRAQQQSAGEQAAGQPTVTKPATPQGSAACQIKGNISSKGERIYHVPGGKWYDATKIHESMGERWFCSEAEARTAGWRPAKE